VESCHGETARAGSGCGISRIARPARLGLSTSHAQPRPTRQQVIINGVLLQSGALSHNISPSGASSRDLDRVGIATLEFQSAGPSVVKSIKQRDLLNTWLRLYARDQSPSTRWYSRRA